MSASHLRILLFSDLHTDIVAADRIVRLAESADIVIGAGDFGNARRNVRDCIEILREIDRPTILVPGNNESLEELRAACADWPSATVLHGTGIVVAGIPFFGIGGGIPVTPFGAWSYDFTEDEAVALLNDCPTGGVLVSHSPPKGAVDVSSSGRSLGSEAVRDAVLRCQPRLVVCGHIHASGGQRDDLDGVPVINAGPDGMWFEIP